MATVNEQIATGRKFRKLIDETTKLWQRISFWTKSSDVEFDDGKDAETKLGAIDGITDSLVSPSSNIAASAKAVSELNNKLGGVEFIFDEDGKITGYKTQAGADTVFPFKKGKVQVIKLGSSTQTCSYNLKTLGYDVENITKENFYNLTDVSISDHSETGREYVNSSWTWESPIVTFNINNYGTGVRDSRSVSMSQYFIEII